MAADAGSGRLSWGTSVADTVASAPSRRLLDNRSPRSTGKCAPCRPPFLSPLLTTGVEAADQFTDGLHGLKNRFRGYQHQAIGRGNNFIESQHCASSNRCR